MKTATIDTKNWHAVMAIPISILAIFALLTLITSSVFAAHNSPTVVGIENGVCGETTFTASVTDFEGAHMVSNMKLVVSADGVLTVSDPIPTDGSSVSITIGPFSTDQTIQWRVFGGAERHYDSPLWNGYGEVGFSADITGYGFENTFDFVVSGPEDENTFTTWHELEVEGCPS